MIKTAKAHLFNRLPRLVFGLLCLLPCRGQAALNVVTTVPSLAAIVHEVAGEDATVQALAQATEDPHFVDARPSFIVALNHADLLVAVGLDLEDDWLPSLVVSARNARIVAGSTGYLEVAQYVDLLEPQLGKVDRAMGDIHPGGNPHFLFAPGPVMQVARGLVAPLSELDPAHASAFRDRAESFCKRLTALRDAQAERFRKLTPAQRKVVTYHRSMAYVLAWLSLDEVATIEPKPGVAPSPAHVAQVLRAMRREHVTAILQEEFYPERTSRALARLGKARLVGLPGGLRFRQAEAYEQHLQQLADAIFDGLHG